MTDIPRSNYSVWRLDPWADAHFTERVIGALTHGDAAQKLVNEIPFDPTETPIPNDEIIVTGPYYDPDTGEFEGNALMKFAIKPSGLRVVDMSGRTS